MAERCRRSILKSDDIVVKAVLNSGDLWNAANFCLRYASRGLTARSFREYVAHFALVMFSAIDLGGGKMRTE